MPVLKPAVVALGILIALNACAPPAPPSPDMAAEEAALRAATTTWIDSYNAGDVEPMVALYAEDGVLMPPHAPVAAGREAIRAFLTRDTAGARSAGVKIVNGTESVGIEGDMGFNSGSYTVTDASGAVVDSGSYLSVSRKVDGRWLYLRDMYNSDRPASTAAPASAQ